MNKLLYAAFVATAIAAPLAHAEGPYVGLSLANPGESHIQESSGGTVTRYDAKRKQSQLRVFGGYDFDAEWGVEAGYHGLDGRTTFDLPGNELTVHTSAFYLAAKRSWQLGQDWSLFAKAGVASSHMELDLSSGAGTANKSASKTGAFVSAGASYMLSKNVALQLELEHISKVRSDGLEAGISKLSLGVRYNF
jgi:OOP family OmpA-OmpF porin